MAENPLDPPAKPPPLPPGLAKRPMIPPPLPGAGKPPILPPKPPSMPGKAPPLPGAAAVQLPAWPAPASAREAAPARTEKQDYEARLADLEKRLLEEREKSLLANLKSQTEAANAGKVEMSIREMQERLRRDRIEQEREETRLKLEAKVQELESRLAAERETWVATLKNQMQARETQDHEIESHFTLRIQEMERRWLEEKAVWQKASLAKDDELRGLRALAEKLKGVEGELNRSLADKQAWEARAAQGVQDLAQAQGRLKAVEEKERENQDLKMRLALLQDKYDRELGSLRIAGRDREERLALECDRLQKELATLSKRLGAEHEVEILRLKVEADQESREYQDALTRAQSEQARLKAICGAQEKQAAVLRANLEKAKAGLFQEIRAEKERMSLEFEQAQAQAAALRDREAQILRAKLEAALEEQKVAAERLHKLRAALEESLEKFGPLKARIQELSLEKSVLERQTMGRAAQLRESEDALGRLRADLARKEKLLEYARKQNPPSPPAAP